MIVLEYLPNGDLRSYLTKMQPTYVYVKMICWLFRVCLACINTTTHWRCYKGAPSLSICIERISMSSLFEAHTQSLLWPPHLYTASNTSAPTIVVTSTETTINILQLYTP